MFEALELTDRETLIAARVLREIRERLRKADKDADRAKLRDQLRDLDHDLRRARDELGWRQSEALRAGGQP